jgi:hypothetical protein
MLCKIRGFHGGNYEECRLLGYTNPVRTSQETRYVSTTAANRLMLCGETTAVYCQNRTYVHCVGNIHSLVKLQQVVHIVTIMHLS